MGEFQKCIRNSVIVVSVVIPKMGFFYEKQNSKVPDIAQQEGNITLKKI